MILCDPRQSDSDNILLNLVSHLLWIPKDYDLKERYEDMLNIL